MSTKLKSCLIFTLLVLMSSSIAYSREYEKIAQTGLKFLTVPMDARASALSGAMTSLEGKSTSLMFNPASMARMDNTAEFALGQVQWIADIKYVFGTAAFSPAGGRYGVFGISLLSVDYGTMYNTILAENDQAFLDLGTFSPTAYAVGIGYARALSDRFMIGGHAKYVYQSLGAGIVDFAADQTQMSKSYKVDVMAYDFGVLYKTGFNSLNFGMNIRNFSQEISYIKESFQLPLVFEMGLSMNVLDLTSISPNEHKLLLSVDATHPRDYAEQLDIGIEYSFLNSVDLRAGYTTPTDEQGISFGAGLHHSMGKIGLNIDYAYTDFGIFSEVQRFTFKFNF